MKLRKSLSLVLVSLCGSLSSSLVVAADETAKLNGALRGSRMKDDEGRTLISSIFKGIERKLQIIRPSTPSVSTPAGTIAIPYRPALDQFFGVAPPPGSNPSLGSAPTEPPIFTTPPAIEQTLDTNGETCGMQTPGTLILHGGIFNYDDPLSDSLGQAIVREMQTNSENRLVEPLVFLPGARREVNSQDEDTFEAQWSSIMADGVPFSVLHADNQEPEFTSVADADEADEEDFVRPLKNAMGVFLPGGRQWRLVDAYKYTRTEEELWNVLKRGGVIAGTSAGAAVMASFMPRGDPQGSGMLLADREWYRHGFGFLNNVAIDNHVSARERQNDMYEVLNASRENRKLLGIGLNENSMIIVKGHHFQVQGDRGIDSVVRVYDCSRTSYFETCSFDNAPYVELRPGDLYDLCRRRQVFAAPIFNGLQEDGGSRTVFGAYRRPYRFGRDFKAGNPKHFLCSGRRCRFRSNPINVDSNDGTVRITGKVFAEGFGFSSEDRLMVKYSIDGDEVWRSIFDTALTPGNLVNTNTGQSIFSAIPVPSGNSTLFIEIEGITAKEGDAQYRVAELTIE